MQLVIGLGNPGKQYDQTRHNIGFMVVDALRVKLNATSWQYFSKFLADIAKVGDGTLLVKPSTFMNDSGKCVSAISQFYKVSGDRIVVVHDDLDLTLGEYKIQQGKGPKDHNGIKSVERELGTRDFIRVRVGVDSRGETRSEPGEEYVLKPIATSEWDIVEAVIGQISQAVVDMITKH